MKTLADKFKEIENNLKAQARETQVGGAPQAKDDIPSFLDLEKLKRMLGLEKDDEKTRQTQ